MYTYFIGEGERMDEELNQNELAVFAYACQLLLQNHLYDDLNKLLEFAKNKGVIVTPPENITK